MASKPKSKAGNDVLLVVDGTWHIHRAFYIRPSSIQYMVFGWVCQYIVETKATHVLVAFDSGRSFRHDIMDGYKAGRPQKQEGVAAPSDYLKPVSKYLTMLGVHCEFAECLEADDLLQTAAVQFPVVVKYGKVVLATPDKDNHQGLSEDCSILKPASIKKGGNVRFTVQDLLESTGFTPEQYLDYQTLIGDNTDKIPKILTPAVAKKIILKHKSLKRFLQKTPEFIEEHGFELMRNRKLVKLLSNCFDLNVERYKVSNIQKGRTDVKSSHYRQLSSANRSLF